MATLLLAPIIEHCLTILLSKKPSISVKPVKTPTQK